MYRREVELGEELDDFPETITVTYRDTFEQLPDGIIVDDVTIGLDNILNVSIELPCPWFVIKDINEHSLVVIKDNILTAGKVKVVASNINVMTLKDDAMRIYVGERSTPIVIDLHNVSSSERMRFLKFLAAYPDYIRATAEVSFLQTEKQAKDPRKIIWGDILFPNKGNKLFYDLTTCTGVIDSSSLEGVALLKKDGNRGSVKQVKQVEAKL